MMARSAVACDSLPDVGPVLCGWPVWGTSLTLGVTNAAHLHPARLLLEEWLGAVDAAANRFDPDSDVSRVNGCAGTWVTVGPVFLAALGVAVDAAARSAGAVDPTVGSALLALGYDRDFDEIAADRWPGEGQAPTGPVAGWERVEIDAGRSRVRIPADAALDLGATAKAWCVDRAVEAVARLGVGVLVDIGGDLAVAGPVPDGGWRVAVQESSRVPLESTAPVVAVSEGAVASSGTTVRCWRAAGRRVHHIIDPRTGRPAPTTWQMVTVAAPTCVEANVAATTAIVRGTGAPSALDAEGRPARLVGADGRVVLLGGWPEDESGVDAGAPVPETSSPDMERVCR